MNQNDLNLPLIQLTPDPYPSYWTTGNAVEGTGILGGIGSGKTSGSGRFIALKFLAVGFGGLVLTVKPDEKQFWIDHCTKMRRLHDLIIVEPGGKHFFNFLAYVSRHATGGMTENLVELLKTIMQASDEKSGGASPDRFWDEANYMLLTNVIDLCKLAYGFVDLQTIYDILQSLPKEGEKPSENSAFSIAFRLAQAKVLALAAAWEKSLSDLERVRLGQGPDYERAACEAVPDVRLLKFVDQFFQETFFKLSEKTRSIVDMSILAFLFRLLRDPVYSLFCSQKSTFVPEDCIGGKIILLNIPVKLYHKIGRDCQIMFKYIWQQAMEKREITEFSPAVFLWADEAQNFLHEHDTDFQATARSSRIATVYISQNLPNYLASMGGSRAEQKVKAFLGTLGTKIFHANADIDTNRYASDLIGDGFFVDRSETATAAGQFSASTTKSVRLDRLVRAEEFAHLKTGGLRNNLLVEGYMHIQGDTLQNGLSHIKIKFNQTHIPNFQNSTK